MLPQIISVLTALTAGVFTGAAIYVQFVEQPARLSCGTALAVTEWRPSYKRGAAMQAPLVLLGGLLALIAWRLNDNTAWLIGAAILFGVVFFTFVAILPTNHKLEDAHLDVSSPQADRLLRRWGQLHSIRSSLGVAAFVIFLYALTRVPAR